MIRRRHHSSILAVAALGVLPPLTAHAVGKLGVVDVQRVMEADPNWGLAIQGLRGEWEKKKAALEAQQSDLNKKKEQLDAKKIISDPKVVAAEEASLLEKAKGFRDDLSKVQGEFARRENQLKEAMLSRVERLTYEVAEQGDYAFVFETGTPSAPNVLYNKKNIDLTDQLIAGYRTRFKDQPIREGVSGEPTRNPLGPVGASVPGDGNPTRPTGQPPNGQKKQERLP